MQVGASDWPTCGLGKRRTWLLGFCGPHSVGNSPSRKAGPAGQVKDSRAHTCVPSELGVRRQERRALCHRSVALFCCHGRGCASVPWSLWSLFQDYHYPFQGPGPAPLPYECLPRPTKDHHTCPALRRPPFQGVRLGEEALWCSLRVQWVSAVCQARAGHQTRPRHHSLSNAACVTVGLWGSTLQPPVMSDQCSC